MVWKLRRFTSKDRFKLRLRPRSLQSDGKIRPLPSGINVVGAFADFMKYLLACTSTFFTEYNANGDRTRWDALACDAEYVISHPNGWEGSQQSKLRQAAARAGLVPNTVQGRARIRFVTEGEASLHYCLNEKLIRETLSVRILRFLHR